MSDIFHIKFGFLLKIRMWMLVFGFLSTQLVFADYGVDTLTFFHFLEENQIKKITLSYAVDSLIINKMTPYVTEGEVFVYIPTGDTMVLDSKFEPRARYRRQTCAFPPIWINLSEKDLKKAGLQKFDNYKLVTHCDEICEKDKVLDKEFLVYKLFNTLSDRGFDVYPLEVEYYDVDSKEVLTKDAFIIESNKEKEAEVGHEFLEKMGLTKDSFSDFDFEVQAMFHYMIGNDDADSKMLHNYKIYNQGNGEYNLIPYDFDFARIVGAYYAHPTAGTPSFWHEGLYPGNPSNRDIIGKVVDHYLLREKEMYAIISEYEALKKSERNAMINYLRGFFKKIKKKNLSLEYIIEE